MKLQDAVKKLVKENKDQSIDIDFSSVDDVECELSAEDFCHNETNVLSYGHEFWFYNNYTQFDAIYLVDIFEGKCKLTFKKFK